MPTVFMNHSLQDNKWLIFSQRSETSWDIQAQASTNINGSTPTGSPPAQPPANKLRALNPGTQRGHTVCEGASSAFGACAHRKELAQARLLMCSQALHVLHTEQMIFPDTTHLKQI